jgi:GMP synthase (glutamine-hydrolysing)
MSAHAFSPEDKIVILDFGSQYTQVIARRVRECRVYSEILPFWTECSSRAAAPKGIILSGGPASVYASKAPKVDKGIYELGVPILGICYGLQLLAHDLGGNVERSARREYGPGRLRADRRSDLFHGLPAELDVWNSHGDRITRLPKGFRALGRTENSPNAVIGDTKRRIYGLQFHPEVAHTPRGKTILENFVHRICGCKSHGRWARSSAHVRIRETSAIAGDFRACEGRFRSPRGSFTNVGTTTCIFVDNAAPREAEAVENCSAPFSHSPHNG